MPKTKLKESLRIPFNIGKTIEECFVSGITLANKDPKNAGANMKFNSSLSIEKYSNTNDKLAKFSTLVEQNTKANKDKEGWLNNIIASTFIFTFTTDVFGDKRIGTNETYDSSGNAKPIYLKGFNVTPRDNYGGKELLNLPLNYPYHHNRHEKEPYSKNKPTATVKPSVFVFVKYLKDDNTSVSMRIIDLSSYLIELETNLTHLGGTFSVKLAHKPIMELFDNESYEIYRGKDLSKIQGGYKEFTLYDTEIDENLRIKGFNFTASENDIIFITSEPFEKPANYNPLNIPVDFFWSTFSSFDMIGLVDISASITDYKNSNIVLNGRDLSKLLMEDGTYWYQYSVSKGENIIFQNADESGGDKAPIFENSKSPDGSKLADRAFFNGLIMQLMNYEQKSILNVLEILINNLSNIQICPDEVITKEFDNQ